MSRILHKWQLTRDIKETPYDVMIKCQKQIRKVKSCRYCLRHNNCEKESLGVMYKHNKKLTIGN